MTSNRGALVLGATGGVGGEVARRLIAAGWTVHALKRDPAKLSAADKASGLVWHRGDAMSAADVAAAAAGVSVTVHAVNPPGYRNWGKFVLPMLDNTIAAARANGARIVLPGNVYNFGPDAFPDLRETSPQNPVTAKGRIRVEMERRLREAASTEVGVLIACRRFLRAQGWQQLVFARVGQSWQAHLRYHLSRQARDRSPMGVLAGCGADHGAPAGKIRYA
jgi:nucleoside-diphosphate-sugar epimerase